MDRYNALFNVIATSLRSLDEALKGIVLLTEDLEAIYECI